MSTQRQDQTTHGTPPRQQARHDPEHHATRHLDTSSAASPRQQRQDLAASEAQRREGIEQNRQQRNALTQGATPGRKDIGEIDHLIASGYENVDQPGKDPANLPGRRLYSPDGRGFKSNRDLEDITGNPGHLNVNPNAPATSINPAPSAGEGPESINQPDDVQQPMPPQHLDSLNEPWGSNAVPGEPDDPGNVIPELLAIDPDHAVIGEPGMDVTLTGEDFDDTCEVTFNGEAAINVDYVSSTEMKATLPSTIGDAGEYPVTVRNSHGESDPVTFELVEPAKRDTVKDRPKKAPKPSKKAKKRR